MRSGGNCRGGGWRIISPGCCKSGWARRCCGLPAAGLASLVKGWRIAVTGTQGLAAAQVTAGGILTKDFDPATLESRRVKGLYTAGEVLDIDGDCGGFNLQWAWASAFAAARAMAAGLWDCVKEKGRGI